jgi:hypothetical protein
VWSSNSWDEYTRFRLPVRLRPARNDREFERDRFVRPRLGEAVREADIGSNLDLDSSMIMRCSRAWEGRGMEI